MRLPALLLATTLLCSCGAEPPPQQPDGLTDAQREMVRERRRRPPAPPEAPPRPLVVDRSAPPTPITAATAVRAATVRTMLGRWDHSVDGGAPMVVEFTDDGVVHGANGDGVWTIKDGKVTLTWRRDDAPGGAWIDECTVAADGESYEGTNQKGLVIRGRRRAWAK